MVRNCSSPSGLAALVARVANCKMLTCLQPGRRDAVAGADSSSLQRFDTRKTTRHRRETGSRVRLLPKPPNFNLRSRSNFARLAERGTKHARQEEQREQRRQQDA